MTAQSPAYALQNAQHSAALFRQAASSLLQAYGVLAPGELAVAAQSTPNMSVQVAAGRAWMKGTEVANVSGGSFSTQAGYFGLNDAPVTVTIAAANPTNPRIDVVYIAVQDSFYSGSTNQLVIGVVTGTPAASPSAPSAPNNSVTLATVAVAANATSITNANISLASSASLYANTRGGLQVCTSGTRPTSPTQGMLIYETDTGRVYVRTSSFWRIADPGLIHSSVYLTTGGSLGNNAWLLLVYDTVRSDPANMFSAGVFTAPLTGIYRLGAAVGFAVNASGTRGIKWMWRTNSGGTWTDIAGASTMLPAAPALYTALGTPPGIEVLLSAGQQVGAFGWQNSGGGLTVNGTANSPDQNSGASIELVRQTA